MKVVTVAAQTNPINTTHQQRSSPASSMAGSDHPLLILRCG